MKIKYNIQQEVNDFAKVIHDSIDKINGEFLVLSHAQTQNKILKCHDVTDLPDELVKWTLKNFQKKYVYDFTSRTQEDQYKFQHYNRYLQIMASHDRDYFLLEVVKSCFYLTYPNWEFFIVDDGSGNPLTFKVLELFESVPKVIIQYLYTNQYVPFANNFGIAQVRDFSGGQAISVNTFGNIILVPDRPFINIWHIIISLVGRNHIPNNSLIVRMNEKMKKLFYYENISAQDYKLWFKLLIDLEQERIRIGITEAHVVILREHRKRMSYSNRNTNLHIKKWTQSKQIDAYNTFSPLLLEQVHSQCLTTALLDISIKSHIVRACKEFDMDKMAKLILAHQQTKEYYSSKDIQELNETLKFYTQYYNQAVKQNRVDLQPGQNRKIFVGIYSLGDSKLLEKQIESLKDHVDGIVVVDINTDLQYNRLKSKNQNPSYIKQKYQNNQKIQVENLEFDFQKIAMKKLKLRLDNLRVANADFVLILGPGEFVYPREIKRFQNYRKDIGIFGLQQKDNSKLITSPKMTSYQLLKFMGFEFLRKYDLDPDIFKLAGEHIFEDNIYTIQYDFGYLNVQTFKNGGYYLDKLK
ncbi:UNKNOWN [Stylonychia lemnae]|uniref:Uncharacterized protein n=1 Tax=Stylonychia lemnae TaxID=5949 RepID=A0A078AVP1_STYLE|nr:UNKNOWN [Stylonychia lemnae]|eukprot:CDW86460.1 UNKNOWN [Stylonychia lemnae]